MWQTWDASVLLAGMDACSFPAWDGYFNVKRRTFPWWPSLQTQHSLNTSELCPRKLWAVRVPVSLLERSSIWAGIIFSGKAGGCHTASLWDQRISAPTHCSRTWHSHGAQAQLPCHHHARLLPSAGSAAREFLGVESTGEMWGGLGSSWWAVNPFA